VREKKKMRNEEVRLGGDERKLKIRRVGEEPAVEGGVVAEEGRGVDVRVKGATIKSCVQPKFHSVPKVQGTCPRMHEAGHHADPVQAVTRFIPSYKSTTENRNWAENGMAATVFGGESTLSLQQRIEDAEFPTVVVTPMGRDHVFLHCTSGDDIWYVFNNALHFFGMLFQNIHKLSSKDVRYERGAWLCIYGVPVQAWNDAIFKLCVMDIGRFIRVDECTTDKARLDFARVLITTTQLEIVNTTSEFFLLMATNMF